MDTTQTDPIQEAGDGLRNGLALTIENIRREFPDQFDDKSNNAMIIDILAAAYGAKDASRVFGVFIGAFGIWEAHFSGDAHLSKGVHIDALARLIMDQSDDRIDATRQIVATLIQLLQMQGVPVGMTHQTVSTSRPEAN